MIAGDAENIFADGQDIADRLLLIGAVDLLQQLTLFAFISRAEVFQQPFRLLDTVPAEVVEHLAGDAHQQFRVGALQQVDDAQPVLILLLDGRLLLKHPFQVLMQDAPPQAFGDGVDQLAFFFQEGTFVRRGAFGGVIDFHRSDLDILSDDIGALHPGGFLEVRRLVDFLPDGNFSQADIGILPAGRDGLDDAPADIAHRGFRNVEELFHPVEAVQLFGPLLQRIE